MLAVSIGNSSSPCQSTMERLGTCSHTTDRFPLRIRGHMTYINTPARDVQDNDMFYYFIADSLTNNFVTTALLYTNVYTIANVPVASALLKQIIIPTSVDNPASTLHIREMLIESKSKLFLLMGDITEFNQWVLGAKKWAAFTLVNKKQ